MIELSIRTSLSFMTNSGFYSFSQVIHVLFAYFYFINHVSNFFIYLAVNKEFRKEAKSLVDAIRKKVQHNSIQPARVGPQ